MSLTENGLRRDFGRSADDLPDAEVRVHSGEFYRQIVLGGSLGAADAFLDGHWSTPDLTTVLRVMARNEQALESLDGPLGRLTTAIRTGYHWWNANTRRGSRRNIAAHYDLGNDFFRLFLDPTMTYSCGLFADPDATMEEASMEKYDRICRQLRLQPTDRVIEIGTGWGGFAIHAARHYGCHVTTTTISGQQHDWAAQAIAKSGLSGRIELLQQDYRDLAGTYDKLVSIEMIEAVGYRYLPTFFEKCCQLLKPHGTMMLQAITIPDQRMDAYRRSIDFIQRYIFPGGFLPSLGTMTAAIKAKTDLQILGLDDFADHYARTLVRWQTAFRAQTAAIGQLGFGDEFLRAWDYYFSYCTAGFLERKIGLAQILLARPRAPH